MKFLASQPTRTNTSYWTAHVGLVAAAVYCAVAVSAVTPVLAQSAQTGQDQRVAGAAQDPTTPARTAAKSKSAAAPTPASLRTRFVIGLKRKVDFDVFALSKPNRVVIELPDVALNLPEHREIGLVKSFRSGLAAPGKSRVVINVTRPVVIDETSLVKEKSGGYRLAIDILPVAAALNRARQAKGKTPPKLATASIQPPMPRRAETPKERAARSFKPVIVIDPGHGGHDTGAVKYGTVEKDVVLAFSHELRRQLEKTGRYRVLMTRDKDEFISLGGRVAFGERHDASLFIAVHADYARSSARGATIFSLRDRVATNLKRSALGDIDRKVLSMPELESVAETSTDASVVRDILTDLAERDVKSTHDRTGMFARTVIETMSESTQMRSNPDQQAAFKVLKTAQFPSVLIELAYVTNKQDARNLKSDEWRERVADSIVSAVNSYFSSQVARLPM